MEKKLIIGLNYTNSEKGIIKGVSGIPEENRLNILKLSKISFSKKNIVEKTDMLISELIEDNYENLAEIFINNSQLFTYNTSADIVSAEKKYLIEQEKDNYIYKKFKETNYKKILHKAVNFGNNYEEENDLFEKHTHTHYMDLQTYNLFKSIFPLKFRDKINFVSEPYALLELLYNHNKEDILILIDIGHTAGKVFILENNFVLDSFTVTLSGGLLIDEIKNTMRSKVSSAECLEDLKSSFYDLTADDIDMINEIIDHHINQQFHIINQHLKTKLFKENNTKHNMAITKRTKILFSGGISNLPHVNDRAKEIFNFPILNHSDLKKEILRYISSKSDMSTIGLYLFGTKSFFVNENLEKPEKNNDIVESNPKENIENHKNHRKENLLLKHIKQFYYKYI